MGDLVGDLGPHMLCTPMFQRFTLSLLNLSLGVLGTHLGAHEHRKSCILRVLACLGASLLGAMRLQGSPWEIPWATRWETWGPICYADRCFSVSHCSLLNVSLGVLGTYLGAHKHRKSRKRCVLAYLGASLLGAMRLQGSPWDTPWALALGTLRGTLLGHTPWVHFLGHFSGALLWILLWSTLNTSVSLMGGARLCWVNLVVHPHFSEY